MQGWGATDEKATLTSVIGLVHVMSPGGQSRRVLSGQSAFPGETVVVGPKSETDLTLPDGSSLSLSSGTKLKIASLKQPSAKDKNFLFTLDVGKLFVQVKKLLSSKSSFEINAGGVICGVRGTSFNLGYNPENHQLDLDVYSGTVGATGGGNTQLFTGGQHGHFVNGTWDGKIGTAPPPPNGTKGGNGSGSSGTGTGGTGSGGNGTGNGGNGGSSGGTGGSSGTGGDNSGGGSTGGTGGNNGSPVGGGTTGSGLPNPTTGDTGTGYQPNSSLGDLNGQFLSGVVVNGDNNLNSAQQTIHFQLILPGRETGP